MTQTTVTRTDFAALRTADTLAEFALRIGSAPYQIYGGRYFSPVFIGASERPAFRCHLSPEDRGTIFTTWPGGAPFRTQHERDRAMFDLAKLYAHRDDPTEAEAEQIMAGLGRGPRTATLAAAQGYPDTLAARTGELRGSQAAKRHAVAGAAERCDSPFSAVASPRRRPCAGRRCFDPPAAGARTLGGLTHD